MTILRRTTKTFPSVFIQSVSDGLDVEVSLIGQLGHGAGNHLYSTVLKRMIQHDKFVDELNEPSTKIGDADFSKGDPSSLYTFTVGPEGHPFHCHASNRIFTAISGSGGAQLRFSTASLAQINQDPRNFLKALQFINIPPDCLFTVRFGGGTWHQFLPLVPGSKHPTFFAISSHPDELGGELNQEIKNKVLDNHANIPMMTELLPASVVALLTAEQFDEKSITTTTLSLDAPMGTIQRKLCDIVRCISGKFRGLWGAMMREDGYLSHHSLIKTVNLKNSIPDNSLIKNYLQDEIPDYQDTISLLMSNYYLENLPSSQLMDIILEGFLQNAPKGVSKLMQLRNKLVRPLGLRISPIGCPVSSLLSNEKSQLFANKYPVLNQKISNDDKLTEVILGIDDKHLFLRSCVTVKRLNASQIEVSLSTAVKCKNLFGKFYMFSIDCLHKKYISPKLLKESVNYAMLKAANFPGLM